MASEFDLKHEKEKNRKLAAKALEESRTYLEQIQKRVADGEDIDKELIDRLTVSISHLENLTKPFIQ